jgi:hypothetical protein
MVRQILSRYLRAKPKAKCREGSPSLNLKPDEWTLDGLAHRLSIPKPTLYSWLRLNWIGAQKVSTRGGCRWILWADDDERQRLLLLHASPLGRSKAEQSPTLTSPKPRSDH